MTRKFFGTDGIRGLTNSEPMTAETALRVGQAAGAHFLRGDHRHRVVIGKDTRLSGYMMETALISGFTSVGAMGIVVNQPAANIKFPDLLVQLDVIPAKDLIQLPRKAGTVKVLKGGPVETTMP